MYYTISLIVLKIEYVILESNSKSFYGKKDNA